MSTPEDLELKDFLMVQQQNAMIQGQVLKLVDVCWDKCINKPRDSMDSKTESCLGNCVDRFIDTSKHITNRLKQMHERGMGQ